MKVIKKGNGGGKEYVCTGSGNSDFGCGAKLLVTQMDLYQTSRSFYDGSTDYYTTFCCPCCGAETDVKVNEKIYGVRPSNEYRMNLKKQYSLHSQS
jgi:rRNA maturation protein Nop10